MSRKAQIYSNYRERWDREHPGVVEPIVYGGIGADCPPLREAPSATGLKPFSYQAKYFSRGGLGTYLLDDGRVMECGTSTSGRMNMNAVWPSMEAYRGYDQPMSSRVYFEEW